MLKFSYDLTFTHRDGKRGVVGEGGPFRHLRYPQELSFVEWNCDSYLRNGYYGYTHHLTHEADE